MFARRLRPFALLLVVACLAGPLGAEDAEEAWRLRLLPVRVVAAAPWDRSEDPAAAFDALRGWIRDEGYEIAGPGVLGVPLAGGRTDAATQARVEIPVTPPRWTLPEPSGSRRLIRLPAALVLEGRSETFPKKVARARALEPGARMEITPDASGPGLVRFVVEPRKRVDVGLYTDRGAHPNAVRTAAAACLDAGLTLRPLDAEALNDGDVLARVRCVLFPGGWAEHYTTRIDATGVRNLRRFVERGGGYVGICAGAFYAVDRIRWEGALIDYPLDLVPGTAVGPIDEIAAWPNWALARVRMEPDHALAEGMVPERDVFYLGGCALVFEGTSGDAPRVLARYAVGGEPAMVTSRRKKGRVFLSGVHLEYDLTSDRDDLTWPERDGGPADPESDWDLFQRAVRWAVGSR